MSDIISSKERDLLFSPMTVKFITLTTPKNSVAERLFIHPIKRISSFGLVLVSILLVSSFIGAPSKPKARRVIL